MKNIDQKTVESFGDEWSTFDQSSISDDEAYTIFNDYFSVFPWGELPSDAEGFDMGCGSGRWARFVAPKVGRLHCIDPSSAIEVARENLSANKNISFYKASSDSDCLPKRSEDFGYLLGVLQGAGLVDVHFSDTAPYWCVVGIRGK